MKHRLFIVIFLGVIFGCSDDEINNPQEENNYLNITVLTENTNAEIYEHSIENAVVTNSINLSSNLNLPNVLERFDVNYPLINFIALNEDNTNFSIYQKNISNAEQYYIETICDQLAASENAYQAIISQDKVGLIFYEFNGGSYPDFSINILDKATGTCEELFIGNGGFIAYRDTLVYDEFFLLKIQVGDNQFKLLKVNLATNQLEEELTFDTNFWGTISDNQLYLLLDNSQQVRYNLSDLSFINASSVNFELSFLSGLSKTQIFGDELEVFIPYPQPSIFEGAPGTLSLTTGNFVKGNNNYLFGVKETLENQLSSAIDFTTFVTDIESNTVVFGFKKLNTNQTISGGIAFGTFDGEISQIIELDEEPFSIIKN